MHSVSFPLFVCLLNWGPSPPHPLPARLLFFFFLAFICKSTATRRTTLWEFGLICTSPSPSQLKG